MRRARTSPRRSRSIVACGQYALLGNRLQNLGVLLVKSGAWERAQSVLEEARAAASPRSATAGALTHQPARARLAGPSRGPPRRGREALLAEALDKSLAEGFVREEALAREFLGDLAFDRGRGRTARPRPTAPRSRSASARRPAGDIVSEVLRRIGEAEIVRGRLDAAPRPRSSAPPTSAQLLDDRYETAVLQRVRGQLAAARGQQPRRSHIAARRGEPARRDGRALRARQGADRAGAHHHRARRGAQARSTGPAPASPRSAPSASWRAVERELALRRRAGARVGRSRARRRLGRPAR